MTRPPAAIADGVLPAASVSDALTDMPQGAAKDIAILWGVRAALLIVIVGLWELASRTIIEPFWISRPSDIATRLWNWTMSGEIFYHISYTMTSTVAGFFAGSVTGLLAGFVLGRHAFLARVLDPFILAIYSLPKVALAPLFILWFGIGIAPKIVLAAVIVFFLVFYNTYSGVRETDRDLVDTARLMGANERQILRLVVIPSSMVWVFTGLKISIPYALIGAVVGEIMASNRGIGYLIESSAGQFDTAGVFAGLVVLGVIATTLNEMLNRAELRLLRWKVN